MASHKEKQIFHLVVTGFGGGISPTVLNLSFGISKMAAFVNKNFVCAFVLNNMEMFIELIFYIRSLIKNSI